MTWQPARHPEMILKIQYLENKIECWTKKYFKIKYQQISLSEDCNISVTIINYIETDWTKFIICLHSATKHRFVFQSAGAVEKLQGDAPPTTTAGATLSSPGIPTCRHSGLAVVNSVTLLRPWQQPHSLLNACAKCNGKIYDYTCKNHFKVMIFLSSK